MYDYNVKYCTVLMYMKIGTEFIYFIFSRVEYKKRTHDYLRKKIEKREVGEARA